MFLIILYILLSEIPPGKTELQIFPKVVAYVEENKSLTFTCTATALQFSLITWQKAGDLSTSNGLVLTTCADFNNDINLAIYRFSCSGNLFNWTILQVTKQQHGDEWYCQTNDLQGTASIKTRIFVKVPVTTVAFSSPTGTTVAVTENVSKQFQCTTSEERPRSTIQWYITQNSVSLGTGTIAPTDNDTLTSTSSTLSYSFSRNLSGRHIYCTAFNIDDQTPIKSSRKEIIVEYGTNGPPVIDGFTNGATYKTILSESQSLLCTVTGGYPTPALTWDCFSGNVTNETGGLNEVRKRITWTASNSGSSTCRCLSNQKVSGQQVFMLIVNVLYPPSTPKFAISTTRVSGTVKVIRGRNITVKCESSSNPGPSYEWSNNVSGQSLSLQSVSQSDEKSYTCTATNTMTPSQGSQQTDSAHSSFILDVLFPPDTPIFKVGTEVINGDLSVVKGDTVQVTCGATSDLGPPTYQWTGQSSGISVLMINSIQSAVTKTCTATNTMNPTVGSPETMTSDAALNIIVMSGPTVPVISYRSTIGSTIQLANEQLLVIKGTDFSLSCSGSVSKPVPTYRWSGKKTSDNYMVSFTNISTTDEGQYTCIAENTMIRTVGNPLNGFKSNRVIIEILFQPEITPLDDKSLTEYESLNVLCNATSNPNPTSYSWTRSKDNFRQSLPFLTMTNVTRDDTDVYTCTVRNQMTPTIEGIIVPGENSITVSIRILYHPVVSISQPNGTDIKEGDKSVILLCNVDGDPNFFSYTNWTQYAPDGVTIVREYRAKETSNGKVTLTFQSISYMDSGVFEIRVSNGVPEHQTGILYARSGLPLLVKAGPKIFFDESMLAAKLSEDMTVVIPFYANPRYKVISVKTGNGTVIQNSRKYTIAVSDTVISTKFYDTKVDLNGHRLYFTISELEENDFAEYSLIVSNDIDAEEKRFTVISESIPRTPTGFRLLAINGNTCVFVWQGGFNGGSQQSFLLQMSYKGRDKWSNKAVVDELNQSNNLGYQSYEASITDLKPGTYNARLVATNAIGQTKPLLLGTAIEITSQGTTAANTGTANTGAAVGGAVAGVLVVIIVVVAVLFILRRYKGFPIFKHRSQSGSQAKGYTNTPETVCMDTRAISTVPAMQAQRENDRSGSTQYESLGIQRDSPTPYETLNTENQLEPQRSDSNVYQIVDPTAGPTHLYSSLQGQSAAKTDWHNGKSSREESRGYDNTRGLQQAENGAKPAAEGIQKGTNSQAVVYSNLKITLNNV